VVIYNVFARMIASYKASLGDVAAQVMLLQSRDLDLGNVDTAKEANRPAAAQKLRVG
jgi:biopolymer transport protein ExbB